MRNKGNGFSLVNYLGWAIVGLLLGVNGISAQDSAGHTILGTVQKVDSTGVAGKAIRISSLKTY